MLGYLLLRHAAGPRAYTTGWQKGTEAAWFSPSKNRSFSHLLSNISSTYSTDFDGSHCVFFSRIVLYYQLLCFLFTSQVQYKSLSLGFSQKPRRRFAERIPQRKKRRTVRKPLDRDMGIWYNTSRVDTVEAALQLMLLWLNGRAAHS